MGAKRASLVINPRAGQNLAQITEVLAVLAAAGWKTELSLKEYGGQTIDLAKQAAAEKNKLVIGYGGDGTIGQVINGVLAAKKHQTVVGVIPGGTANVWAGEVGIPGSPVKAALQLIDSQPRKIDLGRVGVEAISFPPVKGKSDEGKRRQDLKKQIFDAAAQVHPEEEAQPATMACRQYFLLMAGLGVDAAVMETVSKPLKYRVGALAVGLSALKKLPEQHPFPVEIRAIGSQENEELLWRGEALQIVVGNTRRYADVVQMTPEAYVDDGMLDVYVVTANDPGSTMKQLGSLLLRRKADAQSGEYLQAAHLAITVPASVPFQVDGSAVKLTDYLRKADKKAIRATGDLSQISVTYRFDACPQAVDMAIPAGYDNQLFAHAPHSGAPREEEPVKEEHEQQKAHKPEEKEKQYAKIHQESLDAVDTLAYQGQQVTVIGVAAQIDRPGTYIIAGTTLKSMTGEIRPVAIRVTEKTEVRTHTGRELAPQFLLQLREREVIIVDGKKSKRSVIKADSLVVEERYFT